MKQRTLHHGNNGANGTLVTVKHGIDEHHGSNGSTPQTLTRYKRLERKINARSLK
jgi:hypothetical protein